MGWNTTIVVMNDALGDIKTDPKVGEAIYDAVIQVRDGKMVDIPAGHHVNAMTAIEHHHADGLRVVAIGGNSGQVLGYGGSYNATPKQILENLAHSMGFRLVRLNTNKRIKK